MKHLNKIIALISALCLVLGMFSGCKGVEVEHKEYSDVVDVDMPHAEIENLADGIIAQNEHFELHWNKSDFDEYGEEYFLAMISFKSKKDGSVWSTIPEDHYNNVALSEISGYTAMGGADAMVFSPVVVSAVRGDKNQVEAYYAYTESVMNGRFSSTEHKDANGNVNGISVTYYFDRVSIVVSVDYYLEDDGFKVSVDPKNVNSYKVVVPEGEEHLHNALEDGSVLRVASVTPAPFMCSTQNTPAGSKDSYFVVPSGSGALMYTDQRIYDDLDESGARTFGNPDYDLPWDTHGWVYGQDPGIEQYINSYNDTPITMPFYGMKAADKAICAIIESSAETCKISAKMGDPLAAIVDYDKMVGYSYISATYNVLGYSKVYTTSNWRVHFSPDINHNLDPLVIGYYPLTGEDANYTGMAKRYQRYLEEKENLKKSQDNSLLNVKLYGSYVQDELFVGVPYEKEVALTTYDDAIKILGELKKISNGNLTAVMQGYGEGGINASEFAGGLTLESAAGDEEALKKFIKYTKDNSIPTFFSFDNINFYESGSGYSIRSDAAANINGLPASVYNFFISTRDRFDRKTGGRVGGMISRSQLENATKDIVSLADEQEITNIAFDTLGNTCYSDYETVEDNEAEFKYPLRKDMGEDVKKITNSVKKESKTVLMDGAFSYAAVAADIITNVPTNSLRLNSIDLEIPLYQIVFQGYRANCVSAINTANNQRTQFLKAIETGSGLSFELINNYDRELRKQFLVPGLHAAYYEDNVELIKSCVNEAQSYLASVAGQTIKNHSYVAENVTETVFENGVTVYVNYTDNDYKIGNEVVKAQGFLVK